jgi:hypothetical protein
MQLGAFQSRQVGHGAHDLSVGVVSPKVAPAIQTIYIWHDRPLITVRRTSLAKPPAPLPHLSPTPKHQPLNTAITTTTTARTAAPTSSMPRCTTPVAMDAIEGDFVLVDKADIEGLSATPTLSPLTPPRPWVPKEAVR